MGQATHQRQVRLLASSDRAALVRCIETGEEIVASLATAELEPSGRELYTLTMPAEAGEVLGAG